jgi:membrane protein
VSGAQGRSRAKGDGRAGAFALGLVVGLSFALTDLLSTIRQAAASPPTEATVDRPGQVRLDWPGWRAIAWRTLRAFGDDRIASAAAGITFYMLLAIFPALSAFVSLYGLVFDVNGARQQVQSLSGLLPGGAIDILRDQLTRLATTDHGALGIAFALSLATSIWSSNAGAKALIEGLNVAYGRREKRNFIHLTLVSLSFTLGVIGLGICGIAFVVGAPAMLNRAGLAEPTSLGLLRWPGFLVLATVVLSTVYRFGPCRSGARWRWITPGGMLAAAGWLAMSGLFSWYVANFGHYNQTYGSLGAIVGFLTWIWLSLMAVLLGAEFNAQIENVERAAAA